jgi:hypothetical protein
MVVSLSLVMQIGLLLSSLAMTPGLPLSHPMRGGVVLVMMEAPAFLKAGPSGPLVPGRQM